MVGIKVFYLLATVTLVYSTTVRQTENDIREVEAYIESKRPEINERYRPLYHIAPAVGWLNDPNGFSYYKSEYHIFYQFYPYDSVWGPMHWAHSSSTDLVNWKYLPTALVPGEEQCFSGSAVVEGDTLVLFYTASINLNEHPWVNQSQYIATSDDGVTFRKYHGNPVLPVAPNESPDFRDPKAWRHGIYWYSVIGTKTADHQRGKVYLYKSLDFINWEFVSILIESKNPDHLTYDTGDMHECPDFFELDGKYILLVSPQHMAPQGDRYWNVHQTGYFIGSFNYVTHEFDTDGYFHELDYGHDFYAAQTTDDESGRRFLISWFNMWDVPHLEQEDGWNGILTLSRELRLVGDRVTQQPVEDMLTLRDEVVLDGVLEPEEELRFNKTAEIIVSGNLAQRIEIQLEGTEGMRPGVTYLRWEPEVRKVVVDRGNGDIRQAEWTPIGSTSWRIFLDASSLELFCGEGEAVFSSRVFPDGGWLVTNKSPQPLEIQAFTLKRMDPANTPPPPETENSASLLKNGVSISFIILLHRIMYNYFL